jgi:predicted NAD/FAD-binding protein
MRIAVIGSGISGLGCAYALRNDAQVTLYEAQSRLGGHTNTVDVTLDGTHFPVDTGFLVFNERTYPNLIALFAELGIDTAKSDMSFAVSVAHGGRRIEWNGTDLNGVFAQRRNIVSPRFMAMLRDIMRFNEQATRVARGEEPIDAALSLGDFLDLHRYGTSFRQWYLLPMAAAIWSCPIDTMLEYPVATFARFCDNHGLLQVNNRPQWYTVRGGARQYVNRIASGVHAVRLADPVLDVRRDAASRNVVVRSVSGSALFDHVVLACHSDQATGLLTDADDGERSVIGKVAYQANRAVLHTDTRLMPALRRVWSSWNYLSDGRATPSVSVTYLLNRLQPLPFTTPLLLSLNPVTEPRADTILGEFDYSHPVFDRAAIGAQQRLAEVQGRRGVWFAGAWTGFGFHEDGLKSGLAVAQALRERMPSAPLRRVA